MTTATTTTGNINDGNNDDDDGNNIDDHHHHQHDNNDNADDAKAIAIRRIFSENIRTKNVAGSICNRNLLKNVGKSE